MAVSFAVRGEHIQLDQLLKAAALVDSGGAAHAAVEAGLVRVDGQPESRKRAKLRPGQRVTFGGTEILLTAAGGDAPPAAVRTEKAEKGGQPGGQPGMPSARKASRTAGRSPTRSR